MYRDEGRSPMDPKSFPVPLLIGAVLMIAGIIVLFYGIYSIVAAVIGDIHAFGLIGGLLIIPLGILLMAVGGVLIYAGTFGRIFFWRKSRRIID